jgi:hypothetical protein
MHPAAVQIDHPGQVSTVKKERLLIQCLTGILHNKDRFDRVPTIHASWLCERLAWHKVLPLAAALADPRKKKCALIAQTFQTTLLKNLAREEFYHAQVIDIFNAFDQSGIEYMPFKGPFWGHQLYVAYHWRHIGDIDILLSKAGAKAAADILTTMGYQPDILEGSLDKEFATRGELALVPGTRQPNAVPVELHWDLMPSPRFLRKQFLSNADFTQETIAGQWRGISFHLPTPEVQLIYHLLHATCQHQFMRFVHISNIVHFLQKFPQLDWDRICQLAAERQAMVPLYYGLKMSHAFYPLPAHVLKCLKSVKPRPLVRMLSSILPPKAIPLSTRHRGKLRRNLFRAAMSL